MLFQVVGESKRMRRILSAFPTTRHLSCRLREGAPFTDRASTCYWRREGKHVGTKLGKLCNWASGLGHCPLSCKEENVSPFMTMDNARGPMPNGFISSGASLPVEPLTFQVVYCWRIQEG